MQSAYKCLDWKPHPLIKSCVLECSYFVPFELSKIVQLETVQYFSIKAQLETLFFNSFIVSLSVIILDSKDYFYDLVLVFIRFKEVYFLSFERSELDGK